MPMGVNEKIDNGDDYSKKTIIRDCLNEGNFKLLGNDNGCPGSVGITGVIDSDYFVHVENCVNVGHFTIKGYKEDQYYPIGGVCMVSWDSSMKNNYSANIAPISSVDDDIQELNDITSTEDMAKQETFVGFVLKMFGS